VALRAEPGLKLRLLVGGMHLSARYGRTVRLIREDGFEPDAELRWLSDSRETPADVQASKALAEIGGYLRDHPAAGVVLAGDRHETLSAAFAATLARLPIAHLHGGEQTGGAYDDVFRHAITKLSHLHLVSSQEHARNVVALGEDPSTVHVVGAPGLDSLSRTDLADRRELEEALGIELLPPVVVVTVHPATLNAEPASIVRPIVEAMAAVEATYVITLPNADPGSQAVRRALLDFGNDQRRAVVEALGERRYWGLMRTADAMLGNSSSALIEAPAVDLPAVNVGDRQSGRHREANVVDVAPDAQLVADALRRALDPAVRKTLEERHSHLADGRVGERTARIIAEWQPSIPPRKRPLSQTL
jgi:UDP-N-acetylglucosamine 2-epimerase (non-hydrolysing)